MPVSLEKDKRQFNNALDFINNRVTEVSNTYDRMTQRFVGLDLLRMLYHYYGHNKFIKDLKKRIMPIYKESDDEYQRKSWGKNA